MLLIDENSNTNNFNNIFDNIHLGTVVDNNDPEKIGRIKCTVFGLYEDVTNLPWITAMQSNFLGGSNNSGFLSIPEIGSYVVVSFPTRDIYSPFYSGNILTKATKNTSFDSDYPNVYGFKDSKGNLFKLNKTTGEVNFTHNAGTDIVIHPDGHIEIGTNSSEYIVMSKKLIDWVKNEINAVFNDHTHPPPAVVALAVTTSSTATPADVPAPNETMSDPTESDLASEQHKVGN
jgi:hypothetical protein